MFVRVLCITFAAMVLGWTLMVRTSDGAGRAQVYIVQPGDSLWSIAAGRYGGDPRAGVWKLQERNGLAGSAITPGERLVLP